MLNKIYDWVDERLDITPIWRDIADHEVPEHVNPAHHFSAFVYCWRTYLFVTVIQILSGMFLTMYYVPDIKMLGNRFIICKMKLHMGKLFVVCTTGVLVSSL